MIVNNNQSWVFIVLVKETTNGAVAKRTCPRKLSHLYLHKWKVIIPVTTSKLKQGPIIIMNYVNGLRLSVLKSPVMLLLSRESDHWDSFLLLSHHKYLFPSTLSLSACTYHLICPYWSQRQEIFSGLLPKHNHVHLLYRWNIHWCSNLFKMNSPCLWLPLNKLNISPRCSETWRNGCQIKELLSFIK